MKILSTIILLLSLQLAYSQKVRSLAINNNYEKYRDSKNFDYVHEDFDTSKLVWVADIRVSFDTIIPGMIYESYKKLKERANRSGANGFRVKQSDIFKNGRDKNIDISVYWVRMEDRGDNLTLHKTNKVYMFGFLGYHELIEGYDVKIQEEELIMHALTYREYEYPLKTEVTIQLGTKARGAKTYCTIQERMFPKFYYFNLVKGSFKNAWIDEYGLSFGLFLTKILKAE